jgi:hypothetical protein
MIQNRIVCFRIDEHTDHRISRILGSRYSTRSRFIFPQIDARNSDPFEDARVPAEVLEFRRGTGPTTVLLSGTARSEIPRKPWAVVSLAAFHLGAFGDQLAVAA